jgi:lactosylceramide 4-alpha-galactosyltransferase
MKPKVKNQRIFIVASSIIIIIIIFVKSYKKSIENTRMIVNSSLILENILDSESQIDINKSIFFIDTTKMKFKLKKKEMNMTLRMACSIESAARSNPNSKIFLLVVAPFGLHNITYTRELHTLLEYDNIYIKSLNFIQFSIDTPLEDFVANGTLFKSIFIKSHTSDALRLLTLWKYGGTYIDTDMIVRQRLDEVQPNYLCRDHGFLNGALLNLDRKNGKRFAELFMKDFVQNFDGQLWGNNGPFVLQRVLSKICKTENVNEMIECDNFHILQQELCYPIAGVRWEDLFKETKGNIVMKRVAGSLVVHFWNKLSSGMRIKCDSDSAYMRLAKEFCPKTVALCKDFF